MKLYSALAGILLVGILAFGAGCAEDDGLLLGGAGGSKRPTPSGNASPSTDPNPSPSGSGFGGGIKND